MMFVAIRDHRTAPRLARGTAILVIGMLSAAAWGALAAAFVFVLVAL